MSTLHSPKRSYHELLREFLTLNRVLYLILCLSCSSRSFAQSLSFGGTEQFSTKSLSAEVRLTRLLKRAEMSCGESLIIKSNHEWVITLHHLTIIDDLVRVSVIYKSQRQAERDEREISSLPILSLPKNPHTYRRTLMAANSRFYVLEEWSWRKDEHSLVHRVSHQRYNVERVLFELPLKLLNDTKERLITKGRAPTLPSQPMTLKPQSPRRFNKVKTQSPLKLCGLDLKPEPFKISSLFIWGESR